MNISFIGFGNMAKAIAKGLLTTGNYQISASSPSLTQGINQQQIQTFHNNVEAIKNAQVIVLAVKPLVMNTVITEILPHLAADCLLISVAAGLSLSWFAEKGLTHHAIIRAMPNTPAAVGMAATPLIANSKTTAEQKKCAEQIFASIGFSCWASKEQEMDVFTALSGSGPAYVFLFIEALIDAAKSLGLDEDIAKQFAIQTVMGAAQLAQQGELSLKQLRTGVTSPGGTTAAALAVLEIELNTLILRAMQAAKQRAEELGTLY